MAESELQPFRFELDAVSDRAMRQCVHCGLCLDACPTYRELGTEMDSPRGRLYLVRALQEQRLASPAELAAASGHLDLCLGCRACETACPSGVAYGTVLEGARAALSPAARRGKLAGWLRLMLLQRLLPSRRGLQAAAGMLRLYNAGLRGFCERSGLIRRLPARLSTLAAKTPRTRGASYHRQAAGQVFPATGSQRGRVCFFTGCVMDALMGDVHRDTVAVLQQQGVEVVVPAAQTCCGALHAHEGEVELARELARRNIEALRHLRVDAFVNNSAGCGAHMQHWDDLLPPGEVAELAQDIAARSLDVAAYLAQLGIQPFPNPVHRTAAYDAPCHLLHAQRAGAAPLALLAAIPGLKVIALPDADRCCGAAGSYTLTQPEMSSRVFAARLATLKTLSVDLLVTGNPGCMMQFEHGLAEAGINLPVLHPMQLAAAACRRPVPRRQLTEVD